MEEKLYYICFFDGCDTGYVDNNCQPTYSLDNAIKFKIKEAAEEYLEKCKREWHPRTKLCVCKCEFENSEEQEEQNEQKYYAIQVSFGNQWLCLLGYPVDDINSALLFRDRKEAQDFIDAACYKLARYMLSVVEIDSSELSPE